MTNRLTLIDADSLCFFSSKSTIEESLQSLKNRIDTIIQRTKATHYLLCLTGSDVFRYKIFKDYKKLRKDNSKKYPQKLKYLKTLKSFLIEEYNAVLIQSLEADDLCAWYQTNLKNYEVTIAGCDKDVIYQLIGTHYNYQKDEFVTTTKESSDRFLALQLLIGDVSDNIPGIVTRTQYMKDLYGLDNRKGIGEVTANKILDIIEENNLDYYKEILKCYISKYEDDKKDILISNSNSVRLFRKDETKEEKGYDDYILNLRLLQLNSPLNRKYYKVLENYNIEEYINEVNKSIHTIEDF